MAVVFEILALLLYIYIALLFVRLVVDWIMVFAPAWRPQDIVLVLLEGVMTLTDPPLRLARKVLPPLRFGGVALDLGFMVVVFVLWILLQVCTMLAMRG